MSAPSIDLLDLPYTELTENGISGIPAVDEAFGIEDYAWAAYQKSQGNPVGEVPVYVKNLARAIGGVALRIASFHDRNYGRHRAR